MENQPIANPSENTSANFAPVNQPSVQPQTKTKFPALFVHN